MQGWVCIMHGENVNQVALRAGYFAISVQDCGFHQQKKQKQKQQQKKKTTMEAVSTIMRTYFHSSDQLKSTVLNSRSESSATQSITLCFVISLK